MFHASLMAVREKTARVPTASTLSGWVNRGGRYGRVSAFDFWAEMVSVPFPKENLKYQRLRQQEEAAKAATPSYQLPPRTRRVPGAGPDS